MAKESLIGKKYGRLTILSEMFSKISKSGTRRYFVKTICDCGIKKEIDIYRIKGGGAKSCGCLIIKAITKHGQVSHPLYGVYNGIKYRCYDSDSNSYKNYGGRGIEMCDDWLLDFKKFFDWAIANGWRKGLLLDRKDNNKGYNPDNCRYVTMRESNENRRNTLYAEYNGEKKLLKEWAIILGKDYGWLRKQIFVKNNPVSEVFGKEVKKHRSNHDIQIGNKSKTLTEWCACYDINLKAVWNRINNLGWDIKTALITPIKK
jgi:hypothetical protein